MLEKILIQIYKKVDRRARLFPNGLKKTYNFGPIKLTVNKLDAGGTYYDSRKSFEEISSPLYNLIQSDYAPVKVVDVGTNYGLISIIAGHNFTQAKIICIEPSTKLIPFINANFKANNISNTNVHNAICGSHDKDFASFSINPSSSQDNRVIGENQKWIKNEVPMVSIDNLCAEITNEESVFLKIDTQGFEENVFIGAEQFMSRNRNWIAKSEFAPYWLKSQGTDPEKLLNYLVERYDVVELSATVPYFTKSTDELFKNKISAESINEFLKYISHLNRSNRGWVDLLIRPKTVKKNAAIS